MFQMRCFVLCLHLFNACTYIHDRIQNEQFKKALPKSAVGLVFTLLQNKYK